MECEVFSGPLLQKNVAVSEALTYKLRGIYGDHLEIPDILLVFLEGEFSSALSVLPVKGLKAPLCVI